MEQSSVTEYRPTEHSDSVGNLFAALAKAQSKFNGAAKSADNPFFKSKYADLNECIEAVKAPLSENELAVVQTIEPCGKGLIIATTLGHSSGEWIRGRIKMEPKKDDDQGRGSSITYGRRYSFAAIVGLAQRDDDGNDACNNSGGGNSQPRQKPKGKTAAQLKAGADKCGSIDALNKFYHTNQADVEALGEKEKNEVLEHLGGIKKIFVKEMGEAQA